MPRMVVENVLLGSTVVTVFLIVSFSLWEDFLKMLTLVPFLRRKREKRESR